MQAEGKQEKKAKTTLLVLDWDDTLFAATEFSHCAVAIASVRPNANLSAQDPLSLVAAGLNKEQENAWRAFDQQLAVFFQECDARLDLDVLLVTNAKPQWIEQTTAKLLPVTAKTIAQTCGWERVISARGDREITPFLTHQHLVSWKHQVFQQWLQTPSTPCSSTSTYQHIVCIGDSIVEHEALFRCATGRQGVCSAVPAITFVWLPSRPCMCTLSRQLVIIRKSLDFLLAADPTKPIRHVRLAPISKSLLSIPPVQNSVAQSLGPSSAL